MDVQKKLARLAEIDGFLGTALFSAEGRLLAKCEPFDLDLKLVASLANNLLVHAQKTSLDMGFGRCQFTYIHTEKALILARCLNEGRNPLRAEPGKCHIHLILLFDNPDSLGIAKLEINKVIQSLAEDFRMPDLPPPPRLQGRRPAAHLRDVAESLSDSHVDAVFDGLLAQPAGPL